MTDKRSVFTDALETLGTIIDDTQKRDAIHLAVEPVVAKQKLQPGQHVTADGFLLWSNDDPRRGVVGIVDPFLKDPVQPGERFWLVLYPRTIKSLRHVWEHPAFPPSELQTSELQDTKENAIKHFENSMRAESKKWIENYVEEIKKWGGGEDIHDYDDLMNAANKWLASNNNRWLNFSVDNESLDENFWYHYEIVTGKKVEDGKKQNFFSCAC